MAPLSARTRVAKEKPSSPGIITSSTTRSKAKLFIAVVASAALLAVVTR